MNFNILGPLEVWTQEGRLNLGGRKQQHILAVLLLAADRVVTVSRLVEAAWEDSLPPTAPHQVRKMIGDLRRRLGTDDLIVTDGPGYRMALSDEQLDLSLFDLRIARAGEAMTSGLVANAANQLDLGLRLWRGPALSGLGGTVLTPAIVQLDERRLSATERLLELRIRLGEAQVVVPELQALVNEHPLREILRGQLMLALYHAGRQAEALRVFADGRAVLADELGIDPSAKLARLHDRILRADPALELEQVRAPTGPAASVAGPPRPAEPSPNMLPYSVSDFAGRAGELSTLLGIAESAGGRTPTIVTIDGMAGVGKTSLALHAAYLIAEQFSDGQLFADLRGHVEGIEPVSPMEALEQLLDALGADGEEIQDNLAARSAMWRMRTAGKRLLILLDDAANIDQIRPLLPGAAGCLLLVTSRARITDLDGVVPLSLRPMSPADSVALVTNVIGDQQVAEAGDDVHELVRVCGHLPLALRIAAARLKNRPMWTVADLVRRLRIDDHRLDELALGNRSVATAIELSYRELPCAHRRLFRYLALVPGGDFDGRVAAVAAGIPLVPAERLLEDLLDARLLSQPKPNRYALHGLLRSYALRAAHAEDTDQERRAAFQGLLDYLVDAAEAAAAEIHPGRRRLHLDVPPSTVSAPAFTGQADALAWFDQEQEGLLAVLGHLAEHGPDAHGAHLPRAVATYLQIRGRLHNHVDILHAGLRAAARTANRPLEAMNLSALSAAQWQLGDFDAAFVNMRRALTIAEESVDRETEGECLSRIGLLCEAVGKYDEALGYLERALHLHREAGNGFEEGVTLNSICVVHLSLGQYELAEQAGRAALLLHRRVGHGAYVVSALEAVAAAELGLGHTACALDELAVALETAQRIGFLAGEAAVLMRYADAFRRMGRLDDARDHGIRALELFWTIQRPALEAETANILGAVYYAQGELTAAKAQHRNALDLAERINCRIETARAFEGSGDVLAKLGHHADALQQWQSALSHYVAMGTVDATALRYRIDSITGHGIL
jgi:DNA-binding SARP family transcriptional activator/predicted negative regulator of RcsB-dependent stress response